MGKQGRGVKRFVERLAENDMIFCVTTLRSDRRSRSCEENPVDEGSRGPRVKKIRREICNEDIFRQCGKVAEESKIAMDQSKTSVKESKNEKVTIDLIDLWNVLRRRFVVVILTGALFKARAFLASKFLISPV